MLIRSQATTLLQIFCELFLYSQVIFNIMRVADDAFLWNSECEWVKKLLKMEFWLPANNLNSEPCSMIQSLVVLLMHVPSEQGIHCVIIQR